MLGYFVVTEWIGPYYRCMLYLLYSSTNKQAHEASLILAIQKYKIAGHYLHCNTQNGRRYQTRTFHAPKQIDLLCETLPHADAKYVLSWSAIKKKEITLVSAHVWLSFLEKWIRYGWDECAMQRINLHAERDVASSFKKSNEKIVRKNLCCEVALSFPKMMNISICYQNYYRRAIINTNIDEDRYMG